MTRAITALLLAALAGCASVDQPSGRGDGSTGDTGAVSSATDKSTYGDTGTEADEEKDKDEGDTADTGDTTTSTADCDDLPITELWMSPDDSNSMSSPVIARERAARGVNPAATSIRTYEFMNYYEYGYDPAPEGSLSLSVELARDDDLDAGEYALQIGVVSEARTRATRSPVNLTMVLDTSGSMSGAPIERLKDSCRSIAKSLRGGDVVSMVTWSTVQDAVLLGHTVDGPNDAEVIRKCNSVSADGGTNLNAGLRTGYDVAGEHYVEGAINRVVLVSDGGANVGQTDAEIIGAGISGFDGEGIYLAGIGVGTDSTYNDLLMDRVTDLGKGAAVFIPSPAEADRMFAERFLEMFDVAAREVEIRLDLPPGFELVRFSGEAVSTQRSDIEPQNLAPNDAMVFYNHIRTPCPEVPENTPLTVTVLYTPGVGEEPLQFSETFTFGQLLAEEPVHLRKGAAVYAYAEALKEPTEGMIARAKRWLARAEALSPADAELSEIRTVLDAM